MSDIKIGKNLKDAKVEKNFGTSQEILVESVDKDGVRPLKLPQYIAGLSATLGTVSLGLVYGWTSPAGEGGANLKYDFEIDADDFSWISSTFYIGAAAGCIPMGMLTDLIGRRRAMLVVIVPYIIGWACVIWPNSVTTLIIGRFFLGVGGGAFCVAAPMYTAEIADVETRGRLGSYLQMFLCTGILMSYILGLLHNMFVQSLISAAVPIIFFLVFFFMPETPTYYLMKGNVEAARKTLIWLRGPHYNVDFELEEQRNALAEAKLNKVSFFIAIRSRAAVKGFLIAYGLMFCRTFSGIDIIIAYANSIFTEASSDDADWSTIVIAVMEALAVFMFSFVVDKWGRRILLMMSGTVLCLATAVLGIYFYLDSNGSSTDNFTWLPLVCICSFNIAISFGLDPIPWMMLGELFSPQIKGIAASAGCLLNWLMAFVVTKFYAQVKDEIGFAGTFWILSVVCALGVMFTFFIVPETKNKTLEQIQIDLAGYSSNKRLRKNKIDTTGSR